MKNELKINSPASNREKGAALIVALILLLVMTILGITAMNSSILQGFMSTSYQRQTTTLATAENILLAGELDVEDLVFAGVNGRTHYSNLVAGGAIFEAAKLASTWPATNYYIEYLGRRIVPGESVAIGGGLEDSIVHVFRVSARETRPDENDTANPGRGGTRIVQSLYVTLSGPDS